MRSTLTLILLLFLTGCSIPDPMLERIQAEGELMVVSRNSGTTLYEGTDGLTGLEYHLITLFAEEIGVKPHFILPDGFAKILPIVARGEAHLAAAGLTITPGRQTSIRFGPAYQEITQQVVYLGGTKRPRKVEDLIGRNIEILRGSSHEEELIKLSKSYPKLEWTARSDLEIGELLQRVENGEIDFTIADSNEVAVNRRFMHNIRVGFDLTEPQKLAWAMAHAEDTSLYEAILRFFDRIKRDGTLDQLLERHYGHIEQLDFVESRTFLRHVKNRLPKYLDWYQEAAKETGIEWQMLAAIGYQESHWNPKAKSPTGVKGIMMLTRATAKQIGVKNRLDPQESIFGGARYLKYIESKLPERIQQPDRLWLTLAGYNVGFGHLEDARILTQRLGDNPDKWSDIKRHLPKLSLKKWYKTLKRGYARGQEPVKYVDNIRAYYELLNWQLEQDLPPAPEPPTLPYGMSIDPQTL
ncbi:MAG: membrane-bound lytic murein transglycosylase MltF [Gammaproteobacteria bacterium]|nr:membrane-bound lytic murein transglycosylase MltF [Gammaproteobacteria bacterium]